MGWGSKTNAALHWEFAASRSAVHGSRTLCGQWESAAAKVSSDSKDFLLYFHGCGSQWNVDTSCAVHLQATAAFLSTKQHQPNTTNLSPRIVSNPIISNKESKGYQMIPEIIRLRSQFPILTGTLLLQSTSGSK
jgi:hypothetical protein